jgi:hypothetical protein
MNLSVRSLARGSGAALSGGTIANRLLRARKMQVMNSSIVLSNASPSTRLIFTGLLSIQRSHCGNLPFSAVVGK